MTDEDKEIDALEKIDYDKRVAAGVARLDDRIPDWFERIDLDALNVSNGNWCVTAQVSGGSWRNGMTLLGLDFQEYVDHGFMIRYSDYKTEAGADQAFALLNDLWYGVISERQES